MRKEHTYKFGYIFFLNLAIISLLLFILSQFDLIVLWKFLSQTILFSALIISIGASILCKSKFNESYHIHSKSLSSFFHVTPYFFLAVLIILAINQFFKLEVITLRNVHLTVLGIFFGFFAFYSNRNRIEHELESEKQKEEEEEKERGEEFEYRFPRINSIWGLRSIVKWMYKEGWAYFLGLILIFLFLNHYPHMTQLFIDNYNSEKYASYIPTAEKMIELKNPFYFSNPSYTKLYENINSQKFQSFWEFPLFFWYLAFFLSFKSFIGFELVVRLGMFFLGLILIILVYNFFKIFFSKKFTLFGTLLFSLSPVFSILARLTTFDTMALIFFLGSIIFYKNKKENLSLLFLSVSFLNKLSFGLIGGVFYIVLFSIEKKYFNIIKMILYISSSFILFKLLISPVAKFYSSFFLSSYLIIFFILFMFLNLVYLKKIELRLLKINQISCRNKYLLLVFSLILSITGLFLWRTNLSNLIPEFLSSGGLLFNWEFYGVLFKRILLASPSFINIFMPIVLFTSFIFYAMKRKYFLSFFISGMVYFIIASKSIRYAIYYNHIFVVLLTLLFVFFIQFILKINRNDKFTVLTIFVLSLILIFNFSDDNKEVFEPHPKLAYFESLIEFIENNTKLDDKILITESEFIPLYLYKPRAYILITGIKNTPDENYLSNIKEEIRIKGFYNVLAGYNVTYLITSTYDNNLNNLIYLFDPELNQDIFVRENLILYSLGQSTNKEIINNSEYDPSKYFKLIEKNGRYVIYKLTNSSE